MQDTYSDKHPIDFDDEIDLRELFYVLLGGKWIIVSLTTSVGIKAKFGRRFLIIDSLRPCFM